MWCLPVETLLRADISNALVRHQRGQVFVTVKLSNSGKLYKTEELQDTDL